MKIVAISNRKGGTGKTTTAVNLAAGLAEKNKSVLLIDADPQANATTSLGVPPVADNEGLLALLTTEKKLCDLVVTTEFKNLELLPTGSALAQAELELNKTDDWQHLMSNKIANAKYDYIIIDTPPAVGVLAINTLVAADSVLVPLQCDYYSLEGLREFANNLNRLRDGYNPKLELDGLLKTMFDDRTLLAKQVSTELNRYFGTKVFNTKIPRNVRVAEAPSHGQPVITYDPKCAGAIAYRNLTNEYLGLNK